MAGSENAASQGRRDTAGELVARARQHDRSAWDALVGRYSAMLWSIARTHGLSAADAEDAIQSTWLRLAQKIGVLREPDSVGSWLATVCRRECGDLRAARLPAGTADRPDPAPGPEQICLDRDRVARVAAALLSMPARCRDILRLLATGTYSEVSAALDLPMGSIGPTRARCLDGLTRRLGAL